MTEEYAEKLSAGSEYQDFVQKQLLQHGIIVMLNSSKSYQAKIGESLSGLEIKLDRQIRKYNNLYIEVAEKSDKYNPFYVESGIYRHDNTWLYCIGDYHELFLIPKKQLQIIHQSITSGSNWYVAKGIEMKQTATSKGMAIPVDYAMSFLVIKHIVFDEEGEKE